MLFHIVSDKARALVKQVFQLEEDILTRLPKEKTHTQSPASKLPEPPAAGPGEGVFPTGPGGRRLREGWGLSTRRHPRVPEVPGLSGRKFSVSHHGHSFLPWGPTTQTKCTRLSGET